VGEILSQPTLANDRPLPAIEIGIGVATGPLIAGAFGGHERLGYSVHGEAVALAQRIQALSHQYGPSVIVSGATAAAADRSFAFLEVDTVAAGRQDPPVTLFAIIGTPVLKASPKFRALTTFHDHIFQALRKQQWQQARALIEQCRNLSGASPKLYDLHLGRIGYLEKHPPGENWDGAFRSLVK
jgi:adenylate cyclase